MEQNIPFQEKIPFPAVACKNKVACSKEGGRLKLTASLKRDDNVFGVLLLLRTKER